MQPSHAGGGGAEESLQNLAGNSTGTSTSTRTRTDDWRRKSKDIPVAQDAADPDIEESRRAKTGGVNRTKKGATESSKSKGAKPATTTGGAVPKGRVSLLSKAATQALGLTQEKLREFDSSSNSSGEESTESYNRRVSEHKDRTKALKEVQHSLTKEVMQVRRQLNERLEGMMPSAKEQLPRDDLDQFGARHPPPERSSAHSLRHTVVPSSPADTRPATARAPATYKPVRDMAYPRRVQSKMTVRRRRVDRDDEQPGTKEEQELREMQQEIELWQKSAIYDQQKFGSLLQWGLHCMEQAYAAASTTNREQRQRTSPTLSSDAGAKAVGVPLSTSGNQQDNSSEDSSSERGAGDVSSDEVSPTPYAPPQKREEEEQRADMTSKGRTPKWRGRHRWLRGRRFETKKLQRMKTDFGLSGTTTSMSSSGGFLASSESTKFMSAATSSEGVREPSDGAVGDAPKPSTRLVIVTACFVLDAIMNAMPTHVRLWYHLRNEIFGAIFDQFPRTAVPNAANPVGSTSQPVPQEVLSSLSTVSEQLYKTRVELDHMTKRYLLHTQAVKVLGEMQENQNSQQRLQLKQRTFREWKANADIQRTHRLAIQGFGRRPREHIALILSFEKWRRIVFLAKHKHTLQEANASKKEIATMRAELSGAITAAREKSANEVLHLKSSLSEERELRDRQFTTFSFEISSLTENVSDLEDKLDSALLESDRWTDLWERCAVTLPPPVPSLLREGMVDLRLHLLPLLCPISGGDLHVGGGRVTLYSMVTDSSGGDERSLSGAVSSTGGTKLIASPTSSTGPLTSFSVTTGLAGSSATVLSDPETTVSSQLAATHTTEEKSGAAEVSSAAGLTVASASVEGSAKPQPAHSQHRQQTDSHEKRQSIMQLKERVERFLLDWANYQLNLVAFDRTLINPTEDLADGEIYLALCYSIVESRKKTLATRFNQDQQQQQHSHQHQHHRSSWSFAFAGSAYESLTLPPYKSAQPTLIQAAKETMKYLSELTDQCTWFPYTVPMLSFCPYRADYCNEEKILFPYRESWCYWLLATFFTLHATGELSNRTIELMGEQNPTTSLFGDKGALTRSLALHFPTGSSRDLQKKKMKRKATVHLTAMDASALTKKRHSITSGSDAGSSNPDRDTGLSIPTARRRTVAPTSFAGSRSPVGQRRKSTVRNVLSPLTVMDPAAKLLSTSAGGTGASGDTSAYQQPTQSTRSDVSLESPTESLTKSVSSELSRSVESTSAVPCGVPPTAPPSGGGGQTAAGLGLGSPRGLKKVSVVAENLQQSRGGGKKQSRAGSVATVSSVGTAGSGSPKRPQRKRSSSPKRKAKRRHSSPASATAQRPRNATAVDTAKESAPSSPIPKSSAASTSSTSGIASALKRRSSSRKSLVSVNSPKREEARSTFIKPLERPRRSVAFAPDSSSSSTGKGKSGSSSVLHSLRFSPATTTSSTGNIPLPPGSEAEDHAESHGSCLSPKSKGLSSPVAPRTEITTIPSVEVRSSPPTLTPTPPGASTRAAAADQVAISEGVGTSTKGSAAVRPSAVRPLIGVGEGLQGPQKRSQGSASVLVSPQTSGDEATMTEDNGSSSNSGTGSSDEGTPHPEVPAAARDFYEESRRREAQWLAMLQAVYIAVVEFKCLDLVHHSIVVNQPTSFVAFDAGSNAGSSSHVASGVANDDGDTSISSSFQPDQQAASGSPRMLKPNPAADFPPGGTGKPKRFVAVRTDRLACSTIPQETALEDEGSSSFCTSQEGGGVGEEGSRADVVSPMIALTVGPTSSGGSCPPPPL